MLLQIVSHVMSLSKCDVGLVLNMADINNKYVSILKENNICTFKENQRKHLKNLLSDQIPNIKFVQPPQQTESEKVLLSKALCEEVDYATMKAPYAILESLLEVARAM